MARTRTVQGDHEAPGTRQRRAGRTRSAVLIIGLCAGFLAGLRLCAFSLSPTPRLNLGSGRFSAAVKAFLDEVQSAGSDPEKLRSRALWESFRAIPAPDPRNRCEEVMYSYCGDICAIAAERSLAADAPAIEHQERLLRRAEADAARYFESHLPVDRRRIQRQIEELLIE